MQIYKGTIWRATDIQVHKETLFRYISTKDLKELFTLKPCSQMMQDIIRQDGLIFDGITADIEDHIKNFLNRLPDKLMEGITNHGGLHSRGDVFTEINEQAKNMIKSLNNDKSYKFNTDMER